MTSNKYVPSSCSCREDIREKVKELGYVVEEHKITTNDGYIISLIRILPQLISNVDKNPVLFVHGLCADANMWILIKPKFSLPLTLSSLGYDVWLCSVRGTDYSNQHINPDISSKDYWNFSLDEIAKYDIVDFINYVKNITHRDKIIYIGYSQGTLLLFAAVSMNPNLNEFIEKFIAIAPVAHIQNIKGVMNIFSYLLYEETLAKTILGSEYFYAYNNPLSSYIASVFDKLNMLLVPYYLGYLFGCSNFIVFEQIRNILLKMNSAASAKIILHYLQICKYGKLRQYDYGTELNLIKYKSEWPTEYDLNCFNIPSYLYSSDTDILSSTEDVETIKKELPNLKLHKKFENFSHLDFIASKYGASSVNESIISIL